MQKKVVLLLAHNVLSLYSKGTPLSPTEATETFFAITKLFQSKDYTLRRLVYLAIKDMSKIASDVIIVTSSLTKDMTGKEDQFRAGAIMALCAITDVSTVIACVVSQQPCIYAYMYVLCCLATLISKPRTS